MAEIADIILTALRNGEDEIPQLRRRVSALAARHPVPGILPSA
jgi:hypothetical protein